MERTRAMKHIRRCGAIVAGLISLGLGSPAHAATFVADVGTDLPDVNPGDGLCESVVGCTLRAAIQEANATPGADVVELAQPLYILSISGSGWETDDAKGDLDVLSDVTVVGLGRRRVVIRADYLGGGESYPGRLFAVQDGGALSIDNVVLERGHADIGGAVLVIWGSSLHATDVEIRRNVAREGGGIWVGPDSIVTLRDSRLVNNVAVRPHPDSVLFAAGSAIYGIDAERVEIDYSRIDHNYSPDDFGVPTIRMMGPGELVVRNSDISGNWMAAPWAGVVFVNNSVVIDSTSFTGNRGRSTVRAGEAVIASSTFSGNEVQAAEVVVHGEGIVSSSTFTNSENPSEDGRGALYGTGLRVENSIIAGNVGRDCGWAADERPRSLGYNVVGPDCPFRGTGDVTGVLDPKLAPLDRPRGSTSRGLVHMPLTGSAALNAGDPRGCTWRPGGLRSAAVYLEEDQGGFERYVGSACDAGAMESPIDVFEYVGPPEPILPGDPIVLPPGTGPSSGGLAP